MALRALAPKGVRGKKMAKEQNYMRKKKRKEI